METYIGQDIPGIVHQVVAEAVASWSTSTDAYVRGGLLGKQPREVEAQLRLGRCVVVMDDQVVVGYAAFYALAPGAWEFGTVVVNPGYRGRGLAKRIYEGAANLHPRLGGTVYETTHDDLVVHLSITHGFQEGLYTQVPSEPYEGLCRQAPCFTPADEAGTACSRAAERGGDCRLCVRYLV